MNLYALTLAGLLALVSACQATTLPGTADFLGRWKITKVVGYADMGGGAPLGKDLVGQSFNVAPHEMSLTLNRWKCLPNDSYRVREVDTKAYLLKEAGAAPEDAKLPAKVAILDSGNCVALFWLDHDHIEVDFLGVFVIAERASSPHP